MFGNVTLIPAGRVFWLDLPATGVHAAESRYPLFQRSEFGFIEFAGLDQIECGRPCFDEQFMVTDEVSDAKG